jgi:hypothetical protein
MRIQIVEVYDSRGSTPSVSFVSQIGSARGAWKGAGIPLASHVYEVEFEIGDDLVWGNNIQRAERSKPEMKLANGKVVITGLLETAQQGGQAAMRLEDSVVLLDVNGELPDDPCWVRAEISDLGLYDAET